jgi:hypothetical protein
MYFFLAAVMTGGATYVDIASAERKAVELRTVSEAGEGDKPYKLIA